jgi:hypothetical protein
MRTYVQARGVMLQLKGQAFNCSMLGAYLATTRTISRHLFE